MWQELHSFTEKKGEIFHHKIKHFLQWVKQTTLKQLRGEAVVSIYLVYNSLINISINFIFRKFNNDGLQISI